MHDLLLICMVFVPHFTHITMWYHPKLFISGTIENEVKKGALRFCALSNLWVLP